MDIMFVCAHIVAIQTQTNSTLSLLLLLFICYVANFLCIGHAIICTVDFSYGMQELVKEYPNTLSMVEGLGPLTFLKWIQQN